MIKHLQKILGILIIMGAESSSFKEMSHQDKLEYIRLIRTVESQIDYLDKQFYATIVPS